MLFVSRTKYNFLVEHSNNLVEQLTRQKADEIVKTREIVGKMEQEIKEKEKYQKLYLDELQKRLELAKLIKEREVKK